MSIRCISCGRQYDARLFEFGRTIDCACGRRVGLETRIDLPVDVELRFFADVMHGRLARWLRAIGIDTAWKDAIADRDLVRRALEENRFILTRDKRLPQDYRINNVLLLESQNPFEQFKQTVEHFDIERPQSLFSRCLMCNTELRQAAGEEVAANVPQAVRDKHLSFYFCPTCNRVYWEGSHTTRMRASIENIFNAKK